MEHLPIFPMVVIIYEMYVCMYIYHAYKNNKKAYTYMYIPMIVVSALDGVDVADPAMVGRCAG